MNVNYFLVSLFIANIFVSSPTLAQDDEETPSTLIGDREKHPVREVNAPLDGGLSILIAAGIGFGIKKAYDKRRKLNTEE